MRSLMRMSSPLLAGLLMVGAALAQDLMVYPKRGQSAEQMEQDKFQCFSWARQQTGFDPMRTPTASTPPPRQPEPTGGAGRGAVRGGVGGGLIGGIAGDSASRGAAIGAVGGAMVGGARRRQQQDDYEARQRAWAQQQAAEHAQKRSAFNRAYAACLEGRGYTVR